MKVPPMAAGGVKIGSMEEEVAKAEEAPRCFPKPEHSFACTCGEDGRKECAEIMEWTLDFLSNPKYPEHRCTRGEIFTRGVMALWFEYGASIDDMAVDMWYGISASGSGRRDGDPDDVSGGPYSTYIQCDDLEHGMAFVMKAFAQHYGDYPQRRVSDPEGLAPSVSEEPSEASPEERDGEALRTGTPKSSPA